MPINNDAEDNTINRFQENNNKVDNIPNKVENIFKQRAIARRDDLSIVLKMCDY